MLATLLTIVHKAIISDILSLYSYNGNQNFKTYPIVRSLSVHLFPQCQAWVLISTMSFVFLKLKHDLVLFVTRDAMTDEKDYA